MRPTITQEASKEAIARANREAIRKAMQDGGDSIVAEVVYADKEGARTRRVLSPVRWTSGRRFMAICLCRCEPREFNILQVESVRLRRASDYVMPVAIVELP